MRSVFVTEKSCTVIELASETSKPCEGTFIYENETYYGCTNIGDQNGRAWCSTKIDPLTYEHVSGGNFYGFCPEDGSCSTAEEGQEIQNRAIDLESCKDVCFDPFPDRHPDHLPGKLPGHHLDHKVDITVQFPTLMGKNVIIIMSYF